MTKLAPLIALMLFPAHLHAQGLPLDFDADAFDVPSVRQAAGPAGAPRIVDAPPLRRSVRYGERTVAADPTGPVAPPRAEEVRTGS
jgi:hypothetical protein